MLIILDRDGVINEDSDEYIKSPNEWIPLPGSLKAIAKLKQAGHQVVIATNQSGIARGFFTETALQQMHEKMQHLLAEHEGRIDGIFYCPHHPKDDCSCRKPKPGLWQAIGEQFHTDFTDALTVGDSMRDIEAAQAVGCKAVLVRTGKGLLNIQQAKLNHIEIFADLAEVVDHLLKR